MSVRRILGSAAVTAVLTFPGLAKAAPPTAFSEATLARQARKIIVIEQLIESKAAMKYLRAVEVYYDQIIESAKRNALGGENSAVVKKHRDAVRKSIEELRQQLRPEVEKEIREAAKRDDKKPAR